MSYIPGIDYLLPMARIYPSSNPPVGKLRARARTQV